MASTGSLGDYLGLPTTIFGSYGQGAVASLTTGILQCSGNKAGGDPKDRKSTRLNSSHSAKSRMPSSA